jgi:hypothetical protein
MDDKIVTNVIKCGEGLKSLVCFYFVILYCPLAESFRTYAAGFVVSFREKKYITKLPEFCKFILKGGWRVPFFLEIKKPVVT